MRLLLILILAGVAAYFTVPTREAHEAAARVVLEGERAPSADGGLTLDDVVGYVKGMMAGEGRYENFYLVSKYTVDMPGASYVECYGAFTLVQCREVAPGAGG